MKTAKEMFEELGYTEKFNTDIIEWYEKAENCICFYKIKKSYESYYDGDEGAMSVSLTIDEHKAIHQRMIELGWLK